MGTHQFLNINKSIISVFICILSRIGFITNFAIQLERIHKRKRKEFLAGILVCFCIIMLLKGFDKGEDFFIFLIYLIQELAFFQYARTYVDDFDNFARRLVGDLGYYE